MTDAERVAALLALPKKPDGGIDWSRVNSLPEPMDLEARILAALAAVRAEERERAASIAENFEPQWVKLSANEDYITGDPSGDIAAAIRAGTAVATPPPAQPAE